jgi:hypothetical protein
MIKKHGDKFVVTNKAGTKVLGTHPSKEKAQKQLAAIEISKAKHMHEDTKRFKDFRNTLTESEYKETLTGYPNRGIPTSSGPINFGPEKLAHINAMLNAISRSTFFSPNEAFIRIKTRLNLLMLDFPWTPYLWGGTGQVPPAAPGTPSGSLGVVPITVTLFGRVDGIDSMTGNVVMNGRANPSGGLQEFTLLASIEIAEDGLYRVNAKLMPKADVVVAEEGVEHDGDSLDEMAQTPARERETNRKLAKHDDAADRAYRTRITKHGKVADRVSKAEKKHDRAITRILTRAHKEQQSSRTYGRSGKLVKRGSRAEVKEEMEQIDEMAQTAARQRDMEHKIQRHDVKAQRGYEAKMNKTGKAAERGRKLEDKHDAAVRRLIARDTKEYESSKLYGRGGKIVKKSVKEAAEPIEEMHQPGDSVKVPYKGKMVKGKIVRHDSGGSGKAQQHGGGYVVDVGEHGSITVPHHNIVKEATEKSDDRTIGKFHGLYTDLHSTGRPRVITKDGKIVATYRKERSAIKHATTGKPVKEAAEQIDELSKATKDAYVAKRGSQLSSMLSGHTRGKQLTGKQQANAVKGIKTAMGVKEELVGGQKKLDVNKNKRLDAQDFALLRNKKKAVKEYTEMMPGIPLMQPDPTISQADQSGKGKRFHKKALKSSMEEAAKKPVKKADPHAGARAEIVKQKAIKRTLNKYGMRW